MRLAAKFWFVAAAFTAVMLGNQASAGAAEKRIALVVGNAAYAAGQLATPANDAGLVAQTLQAAGFDVIGARDLDEDGLRRSLRDFVDKAANAGPDAVAFVYLSGYGLQLEGENYFAPVDLRVATAADVSLRALRISDYAKSLAALPLKARFIVLDAARRSPFNVPDKPLAGGLALTEAEPGNLMAFNAAPGTVGPDEKGPYGAYAQALIEMIREGGLQPGPLFDRVRLRVDAETKGAEVPWDSDRTGSTFVFFERSGDAPAAGRPAQVASLRDKPLRELGARDAYAVCLERDDLPHYEEFVAEYPRDDLARRVRALIAARREALVWQRTWMVGTPAAYWSYLDRYPRGPHAWDARRRLSSLAAAFEPPPRYAAIAYDVPPPPPDEIIYVDRPVLYLDDPVWALPPPPPPPIVFLPPPPPVLWNLAPPPPVVGLYVLPSPPIVAVPAYVSAPSYVAPPPNNIIFQNIHNTTVIEHINQQNAVVPAAAGSPAAMSPGALNAPSASVAAPAAALGGAAAGVAASRVALPANLGQRAATAAPSPTAPVAPVPGQQPMVSGRAATVPASGSAQTQPLPAQPGLAHTMPGANGQPLPQRTGPVRPMAPQNGPAQAPAAAARANPAVASPQPLRAATPMPNAAPGADPRQQAEAARRAATAQRMQEMQAARQQAQAAQASRQQAAQAARQQAQAAQAARQQANRQQMQAARQQDIAARQQAQAARQQAVQASQQRQAMQAQRAEQMAQRQQQMMMHQQQMMARQQRAQAPAPRPMMAPQHAPAPAPRPAPHGGGHPPCRPGAPCR